MDTRRIQEAIRILEHEVPSEGAQIRMDQYGGGPDEGRVVGNEAGYLRLGIEFLKGAFAPTGDGAKAQVIELNLESLLSSDSTIRFNWFERRDDVSFPKTTQGNRVAFSLILLALAAGVLLAVVGLVTVIRWIAL